MSSRLADANIARDAAERAKSADTQRQILQRTFHGLADHATAQKALQIILELAHLDREPATYCAFESNRVYYQLGQQSVGKQLRALLSSPPVPPTALPLSGRPH